MKKIVLTMMITACSVTAAYAEENIEQPEKELEEHVDHFAFGGLVMMVFGADLEYGYYFNDHIAFRTLYYRDWGSVEFDKPEELDLYYRQVYCGLLFDLWPGRLRGLYLNLDFMYYQGVVFQHSQDFEDRASGFSSAMGIGYIIRFKNGFRMGLEYSFPIGQTDVIRPPLGEAWEYPQAIGRLKFGAAF